MNADKLAAIAGSIVFVAGLFTIVSSANTASIITSVGNAFAGSIRAAQGRS